MVKIGSVIAEIYLLGAFLLFMMILLFMLLLFLLVYVVVVVHVIVVIDPTNHNFQVWLKSRYWGHWVCGGWQGLKSSLPSWEHKSKLPGQTPDFCKPKLEKYQFLWLNLPKLIKIDSKNIFIVHFLLKPIFYLLTPLFGSLSIGLFWIYFMVF